jgi:hypothetical protein
VVALEAEQIGHAKALPAFVSHHVSVTEGGNRLVVIAPSLDGHDGMDGNEIGSGRAVLRKR